MLCLPQILIFIGSGKLSPIVSLVALAAVPVLLAVGGRLMITPAVCGLAGVLFLADQAMDISLRQSLWLLFPLAASGLLAWALACAEKIMQEMSIAEALFGQCTVCSFLLFIAAQLMEHGTLTWSATTAMGFAIDAALIIVCGYLLFYWLLSKVGAGRASTLQWTQPFVATAESAALMAIRPGWAFISGGILIVIATVWVFSNRDQAGGVLFEITQR
jgi:drug/metabolite transporter (DMT)-like permease